LAEILRPFDFAHGPQAQYGGTPANGQFYFSLFSFHLNNANAFITVMTIPQLNGINATNQ
jgi:hypothetical protein